MRYECSRPWHGWNDTLCGGHLLQCLFICFWYLDKWKWCLCHVCGGVSLLAVTDDAQYIDYYVIALSSVLYMFLFTSFLFVFGARLASSSDCYLSDGSFFVN